MSFSMRPKGDDAVQRYLDEERRQQEQERAGMLGGFRPDASASPIATPDERPELPQAAPQGFKAPAYWRNPSAAPSPTPATTPSAGADGAPDAASAVQPTAASGAGAGAAAGVAAANPFLAVLGQFLDRKRQQQEMKRQGARDLQADYASSLGYPTDRLRAAQINHAANDIEGEDFLRFLLPFNGGRHLMG